MQLLEHSTQTEHDGERYVATCGCGYRQTSVRTKPDQLVLNAVMAVNAAHLHGAAR